MKLKYTLILIFLFLKFTIVAFANPNESTTGLATTALTEPLINEIVEFKPVQYHHFNIEAPQNCGTDANTDKSARVVKCQFHSSGSKSVLLSICDNDKKYCKQETHKISVQSKNSDTPRMQAELNEETLRMQKQIKDKLMKDFISVSPEVAKEKLKDKKAILVLVSTEWCPPCNLIKEFLLSQSEFKNLTKDYLLVYVDGDAPIVRKWKPITKSFFYPSFVILNKNLELISLNTDYLFFKDFKNWLSENESLINDPLASVKARVDSRIKGEWLRYILDLFNTNQSISSDHQRLVKWMMDSNRDSEALYYMQEIDPTYYRWDILSSYYNSISFGEDSTKLSQEEKKEKLSNLALQLLEGPVDKIKDYASIATTFCSSQESDQIKVCTKYIEKALKYESAKLAKNDSILKPHEQMLESIFIYQKMARLQSANQQVNLQEENLSFCRDKYSKLIEFSPLKTLSRSVRIGLIACASTKKSNSEDLELLLSLTKDYPFEETFHRKLAEKYLSLKQFNNALNEIEKAITYSYGSMWIYNIVIKSRILKSKGQIQLALNVLKESLQEISIDKDPRDYWWLKTFRDEYATLKSLNDTH